MTELRTLKDLGSLHSRNVVQFEQKLKAEAVKWVKMFQSRKDYKDCREASGAEESFKNFFNITEEDLK